jgi:phosphoglycerate kinase
LDKVRLIIYFEMFMLQDIRKVDLTNKRVLMRADFNISLDGDGDVKDRHKVEAARQTVDYVLAHSGATLAIMSHMGRPKDRDDKQYSMAHIRDDVSEILQRPVRIACDCIGVCVSGGIEDLPDGEILLLENLRYHVGEKNDDSHFAQQLAAPFDVYINDAFSVCHRSHASVHAIQEYIESYAGIWLQREVEILTKVRDHVEQPAVAIIGGAKIDTKIPLISALEQTYSSVLVGGRTSVEALEKGLHFSEKVMLPVDFVGVDKFDIGPKAIKDFVDRISVAKTIIWNGPLGKFEEKPYDKATLAIAQAIADNQEAFSVVGGGESVQALTQAGLENHVSFVSTGGGAMLAFLAGESMPGLA